jgi:hypothetical protein
MQTMIVTIAAMEDGEAVADCQADIDLDTFEITELSDPSFMDAPEGTYDGFSIIIEDIHYAVSVDYMDDGNEFMLMDGDGIDAINKYADTHPDKVEGVPDEVTDDDLMDDE